MQNFKPLDDKSKVIILFLAIFLFGLLIFNTNKNNQNRCIDANSDEILEWFVNLKK